MNFRWSLLLVLVALSGCSALVAPSSQLAPVTKGLHPAAQGQAPSNLRLRGGGLPPTDVIVKTAIGGALGACLRALLQAWTPEISKYGPWKHIVGVNFFGAFMLGLVTGQGIPKSLAPILITAFRITSAIVTVDAYGLYMSGKQQEALFYFAFVVPFNCVANHLGREVGKAVL
mmetsp:Transcript_39407/g.61425  ORF Transcript_39407/g.61425 Transcript_39407/m.61425 type:complete len:173 (-) Transcript_39407:788-1306(-)|eukprot:CAMPEP_0184301834 /NCGR_PEP_ID=MMETSP1049-20130417/11955_1 /TAXON_ID=77928 /ORGANISM="Proteomonas sulcata, Strain CCMP704" /LENGTH=172 /DNA_ID=CAMNT_0026612955 /DNA_START=72 /DNA_END=590 /DNA_ORIENTATION=-